MSYICKINKAMTCYFVGEDKKRIQMSNDEFVALWNSIESIEGEASDFTTDTDEEKKIKDKEVKKPYNDKLNQKNKDSGFSKNATKHMKSLLTVKGVYVALKSLICQNI